MIRSSLTFVAILVLTGIPGWISAEEIKPNQYRPYVSLLQAQKSLHDAEYQNAAHRLQTLEELRAGGHASWLEVRRQRLSSDSLHLKAQMYDQFLRHAQSVLAESNFEMHEDPAWSEAQVHFTDMHIRMGSELRLKPEQVAEMVAELSQELNRQNEQVSKLASSSGSVYVPAIQHRMNMARGELAVTQARIKWLQGLNSAAPAEGLQNRVSLKNRNVSSEATEIQSAAMAQCEAHATLIEHMMLMEGQRLEKVRELKAMSMASQKDVDLLQNKMAILQDMKAGQMAVSKFIKTAKTRHADANQNEQSSVAQTRGGFQKFEAQFQLQTATLEKNFLTEVLSRLEQAAQRSAMNESLSYQSGLSQTLKTGQQNEINNYRNQIRLAELKADLAQRRIAVIELQNQQSSFTEFVIATPASTDDLVMTLNSMALMTQFLTVADSSELLLESMVNRNPIGSLPTQFRDFDINYRPIRLTDSGRSFATSYRPANSRSLSGLGSRSHVWTYQYGGGLNSRYNYGSTRLYGSPGSLGRYGSHHFGSRHVGLPNSTRTYPFGTLDSRLRGFQRPGTSPWLLPGSPSNFRGFSYSWRW